MIGKTLIHYEITAEIGKGGMGEVYQAKDTKLGRDVAIKVLPEEFAMDADRVARFQREAKLLASHNHPNIAAIHGLEEFEGTHFLVLELIEGQTLSDRIKTGSIPVEEALKLALQMAEALEEAHEKSVIHRDLKPANIKVTPDGKVKVLDFGLAKAYAGDQENVSPLDSPTISAAATQQGVILGTAAYMSPEQARGETVDKKADIWAFGVVLFEMLTGRQVFTGRTVSDTLASVLAREPEWNGLPPNLHPRIRFLLERCLKKEPKDRYSGISDARVEIQEVLADPSGVFAPPIAVLEHRKKLKTILPWALASLVLGLIIAGGAIWKLKPNPPLQPKQVIRFEYDVPEGQQFSYSNPSLPVIEVSPDGGKFVYGTTDGLYIRSIDGLDVKLINGTKGNSVQPFFSREGRWIGYFSGIDQTLKKISISGGVPMTLGDAVSGGGFSWGSDNRILHGEMQTASWISGEGGDWETLFEYKGLIGSPRMLPGGESVLFTDHSSTPYKIMVWSLKSGKSEELLYGVSARYVKTGHILYGMGNNLCAVPFDADTLELTGGQVPVVEGVSNTSFFYNYAISDSGTLVYMPGTLNQRIFVWVDREGNEEPSGIPPDYYYEYFKISPDGTRVVLTINEDGNRDIHIWDMARKNMTRLTFDEAFDIVPLWTPDGKRIIFCSGRNGMRESVFWKAADGAGKAEPIVSLPDRNVIAWSVSADGGTLFLAEDGGPGGLNIGKLSLKADRSTEMLLKKEYSESKPQISPDGRYVAYQSDSSGRWEIYVRPFPEFDSGGQWQISRGGGEDPLWSPTGKELFYRGPDAIMAVSVETEAGFTFGAPEPLFPNKYIGQFDVDPNSEKFLVLKESGGDSATPKASRPKIDVVVNWFEELKQRVPVD